MNNDVFRGIGVDITEVINELGVSIHLLDHVDSPIYEKIDYESNTQMTKPFTVEHFLLTTFTHTSKVEAGDSLYIPTMNAYYRVMNVSTEVFEDRIIYKQCVLYKCNALATVFMPIEHRDSSTMKAQQVFSVRDDSVDIRCLLTDKLYGSRLDDETQPIIQMDIRGRVVYLPKTITVEVKDRITFLSETVPYEVTTVENNSFPGIRTVYLEEDTRANIYSANKAPVAPPPLLP